MTYLLQKMITRHNQREWCVAVFARWVKDKSPSGTNSPNGRLCTYPHQSVNFAQRTRGWTRDDFGVGVVCRLPWNAHKIWQQLKERDQDFSLTPIWLTNTRLEEVAFFSFIILHFIWDEENEAMRIKVCSSLMIHRLYRKQSVIALMKSLLEIELSSVFLACTIVVHSITAFSFLWTHFYI